MSEMVERCRDELRDEGLKIFGATWSNDIAERLVRRVIAAMRPLTTDINGAIIALGASIGSDDPRSSSDVIGDMDIINAVWGAIIDAVLAEEASDV